MTQRLRQLPLDLPVETRLGEEDFLVGPSNEAAHALLAGWPHGPDRVLRLEGPEGSGKTHLAAIFAARTGARRMPARDVRGEDVPRLADAPGLVIEDADIGPLDEAALFHLTNRSRERGSSLVVTARTPPDAWGLTTRDLLSRLRLAPVAALTAPDDALLRAVIVKLFVDRQLIVDTGVVDYLALRIERSLAAAASAVAGLDRLALGTKRRVTKPLAASLFAQATPDREEDDEP